MRLVVKATVRRGRQLIANGGREALKAADDGEVLGEARGSDDGTGRQHGKVPGQRRGRRLVQRSREQRW